MLLGLSIKRWVWMVFVFATALIISNAIFTDISSLGLIGVFIFAGVSRSLLATIIRESGPSVSTSFILTILVVSVAVVLTHFWFAPALSVGQAIAITLFWYVEDIIEDIVI